MKPRQQAQFFQQLALLLREGVPLLRALEVLLQQLPAHSSLQSILPFVLRDLSSGHMLSAALQRRGGFFPPICAAVIAVGEKTGALVACLTRLGEWLEREEEFRRHTRQALTYPLLVLGVALALSGVLLVSVVPSFATILQEMEAPLPWNTRLLLHSSALLCRPWGAPLLLALGGGAAWVLRGYLATPAGKRQGFEAARRLPLAGRLIELDCFARYCEGLAIMLEAGVTHEAAFRLAAQVCGHPLVQEDSPALIEALRDGESVGEYMAAQPDLYPATVCHLLRTGEDAGLVVRFLQVAANSLELELISLRQLLLASLEPLLMLFVAALVGSIVLSLLLPLQATLSSLLAG
jgi:type II secretory pathway component PulF